MLLFEFSIHLRILKNLCFKKKNNNNVFDNTDNKKCFMRANQHITMISEGSSDPEDWSNGDELSFVITGINSIFFFYCIFSQINAALA